MAITIKEAKEEARARKGTSNKEENKGQELSHKVSTKENCTDNSPNEHGAETLVENYPKVQSEEKGAEEQPKQLRIIASDGIRSLVNTANDLGITDIVQFVSSDKFNQFYLIYRK